MLSPANVPVMFVIDYDCITAAGDTREKLMAALYRGQVCSHPAVESEWTSPVMAGGLVARIDGKFKNSKQFISENLSALWQRINQRLDSDLQKTLMQSRVGLFFSSTKGCVEDYIYNQSGQEIRTHSDPYVEICQDFESHQAKLRFSKVLAISNACSSSHVTMEYAQELFKADRLDYAVLIAADVIGPFVYKGFNSLKVLSHTHNYPFSAKRDGLQLGEALAVILLSRKKLSSVTHPLTLQISHVKSDTEGSSITRPSVNGLGLLRTLQDLKKTRPYLSPDLVIAHGTGTQFNDQAEDLALKEFLTELRKPELPVTCTKWSIGHTLGASGCIDLISACEVIKNQNVFSIGSHEEKDPKLKMNYLLKGQKTSSPINHVLITSLGFGGVHASLFLEKTSP